MNKQIYTLLLLLISSSLSYGQQRSFDEAADSRELIRYDNIQASDARSVAMDVVLYPSASLSCSDSVSLFVPDNGWGFVSGTNNFMDLAKAQRLEFTSTDQFQILGGIVFFAIADVIGDGELKMNMHELDKSTGGPGDPITVSSPVKVSEINLPDSNGVQPTAFAIPMADIPTVSQPSFYASVDFTDAYTKMDTVGIFQTLPGCGLGEDTWEQFSNGTWSSIRNSWMGLEADFIITALVEFDELSSAESFIGNGGLRIYPAFPNPAKEKIILNYEIEQSGPVR
ncbi:MAG: hypothetical protein OEQ53_21360, partial [Saprospiraceae bacterium]|nr:hypothetical protein [Saprospiraceae bacterium]